MHLDPVAMVTREEEEEVVVEEEAAIEEKVEDEEEEKTDSVFRQQLFATNLIHLNLLYRRRQVH